MLGRDALHSVRFVENHEIILEENAPFDLLVEGAKKRKEKRVVQYQHVSRKIALSRALEEAGGVLLCKLGLMAADARSAQAAFGANLAPDIGRGFNFEVREAAIAGGLGPFIDALEFLDLRGSEQTAGLLHRLMEAAGTQVIRPAFEHAKVELHRQDSFQHRQGLLRNFVLA